MGISNIYGLFTYYASKNQRFLDPPSSVQREWVLDNREVKTEEKISFPSPKKCKVKWKCHSLFMRSASENKWLEIEKWKDGRTDWPARDTCKCEEEAARQGCGCNEKLPKSNLAQTLRCWCTVCCNEKFDRRKLITREMIYSRIFIPCHSHQICAINELCGCGSLPKNC